MLELQDVISLLIALIAVAISLATLQQNRKMVEETTRPYISITFDSITICTQKTGFIIKNHGQSAAIIASFEVEKSLLDIHQNNKCRNEQFDFIAGTIFAPGQSVFLPYKVVGIENPIVTFKISYSSDFNTYHSEFTFDVAKMSHRFTSRTDTSSNGDMYIISQCLQELIERQL